MSGAHILFEQYKAGGYAYLQSLIGNEIETHLQDFKQFRSTNPNNWGTNDKSSLSESLSGFANAEGGLIIWGVDCRRGIGPTGGDVVQALVPIPNLIATLAQMNTLTASLVSPAIIGVEHYAIDDPASQGTGFIVSYVPKGESNPHMAMTGNKYMYRSGSSFLPMSEWMVADRYGRRPQAKLKLMWKLQSHGTSGGLPVLGVHIAITNDGLGSARYPGFALKPSATFQIGSVQTADVRRTSMDIENSGGELSGQGTNELIIHPKRAFKIGVIMNISVNSADIEIPYELFCDGFYCEDSLLISIAAVRQQAGI